MITELSRVVMRNLMLCDGTPRRETGYRAFVEITLTGKPTLICQSPLLQTEVAAKDWQPDLKEE